MALKYIGRESGGQYLMGVPRRDLDDAALARIERSTGRTAEQLVATGLYVLVDADGKKVTEAKPKPTRAPAARAKAAPKAEPKPKAEAAAETKPPDEQTTSEEEGGE